jgi:hypothetical protein
VQAERPHPPAGGGRVHDHLQRVPEAPVGEVESEQRLAASGAHGSQVPDRQARAAADSPCQFPVEQLSTTIGRKPAGILSRIHGNAGASFRHGRITSTIMVENVLPIAGGHSGLSLTKQRTQAPGGRVRFIMCRWRYL